MLNSFLAYLDNNATPPSTASTDGQVIWPVFTVKTFTANEQVARDLLFTQGASRTVHFTEAISLLWIVDNSVVSSYITRDDPRITYTNTQLLSQFTGIAVSALTRASVAIGQLDTMRAQSFLTDELLDTYIRALSPLDKLAAVIAHFGKAP